MASLLIVILMCLASKSVDAFVSSKRSPQIWARRGLVNDRSQKKNSSRWATEASDASVTDESSSSSTMIKVALTREAGKNDKLRKALSSHPSLKILSDSLDLKLSEVPCIEHEVGPDLDSLHNLLSGKGDQQIPLSKYDYILITSPESAQVFGEALQKTQTVDSEIPKIAAVGKATQQALTKQGLEVDFVPTKANGETLATELPCVDPVKLNRVLYPASAKAADTIQTNLEKRKDASFQVTRLDTYDTTSATFTEEQRSQILDGHFNIACFGSPSSVQAWLSNVDEALQITDMSEEERRQVPGSNGNVLAVCIGSTSARACRESKRWAPRNIYYPKENPGVEGWAESCFIAIGDIMERDFWGGGW